MPAEMAGGSVSGKGSLKLPAIAPGVRASPGGGGPNGGSFKGLPGVGGGSFKGSLGANGTSEKRQKSGHVPRAVIKFQPASPGQVLEMAAFLGVDSGREFYLLPTVKRAVAAPFPSDWAVGEDQNGEVYYYNKFTMKVIAVHPLSDAFIGWVQEERKLKEEELAAFMREREEDEDDPRFREEMEERMGTPWMRFTTDKEGEFLWFNFKTRRLHTPQQYTVIMANELEERRRRVPREDPNKVAKLQMDLKVRRAMERAFATGLRKYWLRWTAVILELRTKQAQALMKAGVLTGRNEARSFRQWQHKIEQLALVRRAMAPLGGRRDKGLKRDVFRAWREAIAEQLQAAKDAEEVHLVFAAWRESARRSSNLSHVKEVMRAMVVGNSLSVSFDAWRDLWAAKKAGSLKAVESAVLRIQRGYRQRRQRKLESRLAVSQRKQIKFRMLRLCEGQETTAALSEDDPSLAWMHGALAEPPTEAARVGGSLATYMLQGALQTATDDAERAHLRQMVMASAKASVLPGEPGFGAATVRDDIARVVDLLDPVDSMRLRATLEAMRAQREAKEQALAVAELRAAEADAAPPTPEVDLAPLPVSPGHLQQLAGAVKTMVSRLTANKEPQGKVQGDLELEGDGAARERAGPDASHLLAVAERADAFLSEVVKPESKSSAFPGEPAFDAGAVTFLEDLDAACEAFMLKVERRKALQGQWDE